MILVPGILLVAGAIAIGGSELLARARKPAEATPIRSDVKFQDQRGTGQRGSGASSQARTPGLPRTWEWWKDEAVKKELTLAEEKAATIGRIYENRVRLMRPFAEEFARELAEYDRMIRERTASIETFQVQVSRVESLRSRLEESRLVMFYRIYLELTPEQYQKLREIRDRRRQGRGGPH